MFVKKYYSKYKKISSDRPKIKDDTILRRIENILKFPIIYGSTKQFLDSVYEQYNKHGQLSKAQVDAVEKIEKKYSKETIASYNEWKLKYSAEKREIAKICALYYKANPPYFTELVEKILSDPNFVPTERQFTSMCENKFTKKVIEGTKAKPKFSIGEAVLGRKNGPIKIKDAHFLVIEVGAKPIVSAAKGSKVYTLLPFGETHTVDCEERYLKKTKRGLK